ncbi:MULTISPECIES: hypothetical protein [Clostridioides]|uniref:hypothetical protein n=1 Tax=unclassified Clostridioides TaxID=2635829 RepID=UPI00038D3DF1|nr:hypothetical protein QEW_0723 [Clostridioides difficile CD160]MCC0642401.1 hypothetical protein [Clostridioides sp. ES-S-0049-03]MCC0678434.1 hypothetical protein [Clostridioides sp. ES-W-0018-02]MCC0682513.1 hypothetical protein [Clostridioides sp. ES-S-0005-03]MCC0707241.1 hypothetical protein [Clostridioides sp. ES-S-0190-01]MCC0713261.1 hypothetical protein [Clostridioides sp. ES-W-0017-02]MDI7817964.1 hypothetical protein [Clostridioides difficile]
MIREILNKKGSLLNLSSEYLTEQDYIKFQKWYIKKYKKENAYTASIDEYLNYKYDKELLKYVLDLKFQEAVEAL